VKKVKKKLGQRWIRLCRITKVLNDQNMDIQIAIKKCQIYSAFRLRKFMFIQHILMGIENRKKVRKQKMSS
jgi:hypothetical protein